MLRPEMAYDFTNAINDMNLVSGFTHEFYRYPARFSPKFAKAIIETFSKPGDWVYDPFSGSGTSLVEASLLGRHSIGTDISSLAIFLSKVKTTCMSEEDFEIIIKWSQDLNNETNIHNLPQHDENWINYQRNINGKKTWRLRKLIELVIHYLKILPDEKQQQFVRCVLLNTAQWALDCRLDIPSVNQFRHQFIINLFEMIKKSKEYTKEIKTNFGSFSKNHLPHTVCINESVIGIDKNEIIKKLPKPSLIITSPPYPGVHVLYHRWQVQSRKETPTPFWIANCLDGNPESYYTMGNRNQKGLVGYFEQLEAAFKSIKNVAHKNAIIVQMVAFSDPSWQLGKYLETMENIGLSEVKYHEFSNYADGRLWRTIPNRKWYANKKGKIGSQKEVTLFHKIKS